MTPGFQTVLHIAKDMQQAHRWRVTQHLAYHSGDGSNFSVPPGYKIRIEFVDRSTPADVLYAYLLAETDLPRRDCDEHFFEAMTTLEVNVIVRYLMYAGARIGGILNRLIGDR